MNISKRIYYAFKDTISYRSFLNNYLLNIQYELKNKSFYINSTAFYLDTCCEYIRKSSNANYMNIKKFLANEINGNETIYDELIHELIKDDFWAKREDIEIICSIHELSSYLVTFELSITIKVPYIKDPIKAKGLIYVETADTVVRTRLDRGARWA